MSKMMFIVVLALLMSACGARAAGGGVPVGEILPTTGPAADSIWTIRFSYTGGIAGFNRKMEVSNTGEATVTDVRTGKTANIQLTAEQLAQMHDLIGKAVFQPSAKPTPCADCFVYTLELDTGTASPFTAQLDDTNLEASGLSPLVNFLRKVMDDALKT